MASWEQVRELALALPETSERDGRGARQWRVKDKLFVWERPLRAKEVEELERRGEDVPSGLILAARVEDLDAKDALLGDDPRVYFTTPHFDGYAAILARLELLAVEELHQLVTDAWLCRAPRRLVRERLEGTEPAESAGARRRVSGDAAR